MLRGIIRERIRGVKREAGIPEGIVESLTPVPALNVEVQFAWPPWGQPPTTLPFNMVWGTASGPQAGLWYRATYSNVGSFPEVVAVCEASDVSFIQRAVEKATITKVGVRCFHCRTDDFGFFALRWRTCPIDGSSNVEELTGSDRFEKTGWYLSLWNAKRQLGDWGLFNWMRDAIATLMAWTGYYLLGGNGSFIMAEVLAAQVDEVQNAMNTTVDRFVDAVNARLNDLYRMWGIPTSLRIVPAQIRNVTGTSFEFLSLGNTVIHFMVIGKTG